MQYARHPVLLVVLCLLSAFTPPAFAQTPALQQDIYPISYWLFLLPSGASFVAYLILYEHISGHRPANQQLVHTALESLAFFVIGLGLSLFLETTLLGVVAFFLGPILYFVGRLIYRLQPAREQRAANQLKRAADELQTKRETLAALVPFLNHLHSTYGRYSDLPDDCISASWYAPRQHYMEYMAALLYTFHAAHNPSVLVQHGITTDTHPLVTLRWLSFPHYPLEQAQLGDPSHPLNVLTRSITDPRDQDHSIFRDLLPAHVDLLASLKTEQWRQPLERHSRELDTLVLQEIIRQKHVIIGTPTNRNVYPLPILYREERFRHTYVIGKTGSGKSTLLRNLMAQDMHHGNGLIVLSPENDLFEKLLTFIPESRIDDLIYFDPTDITPPIIGFNPFTLETGENLNQKVGETMTALKRALGDLGVTMEPLIHNAVYALLQRPHSTFADLIRLIDPYDSNLRAIVKNDSQTDEATRLFWQRYEHSPYYQKSHEAVLNRLNPFFRPPISTILATPSLSFKTELSTERRIIFLDLSRLRGTEAATIGQLLLAEIQQSLLLRDALPEHHRIPYYLYIDEFQTYAGDSEESLKAILNGARKYKLGITLAHQTTADIPPKLLSTIVGNVGTVIALQLAAEDAPFFAKQLQLRREGREAFAPDVLQNLNTGDGYVQTPSYKVGVQIAIPAMPVIPLPPPIPRTELKAASKQNFGLMLEPTQTTSPRQPEPEPRRAPVSSPEGFADDTPPPDEPRTAPSPTEPAVQPRQARKPVVRPPRKTRSVIPEEHIDIA